MKHSLLTLVVTLMSAAIVSAGPIHTAAEKGDLARVQKELDKGVNVNAKDWMGYTPLHLATTKEIAELLIAKGADVNAKDDYGKNPLHLADTKEIAELLIAEGADVNAKTNDGWTPLDLADGETADLLRKHGGKHWTIHGAARGGDIEAVKEFLAVGADVNAKDDYGWAPLLWAAFNGHKEAAELLIAEGADVNAKGDDGCTPLHTAAEWGYKKIIVLLIANGADVNAKDDYGWTPWQSVMWGFEEESDYKEIIQLFINNGLDVNAKGDDGYTPLHDAVYVGKEVVELLIANGADVLAKDDSGDTPLDNVHEALIPKDLSPEDVATLIAERKEISELLGKLMAEESLYAAAKYGYIQDVKEHLEAGVNVNARDDSRETPLDAAEQVDKKDSPEIIAAKKEIAKLLRENGGMTSEELLAEWRKLLDAIKAGNIEAVKESLAAGAEVNYWSWTLPLGVAALNGHTDIVELLINEGANVKMHDGQDSTALHGAAKNGNVEIAILLLDAGAYVNDVDIAIRTPLHYAAQNGHKEVAELLIANGANMSARDWYGETPLDFTESANHFDYAENTWLKDSPEIKSVKKEIANIILENGGKSGAEFSIDVAVKLGNLDAVKQHLAEGEELNAKEKNNFLRYAAYWGRKEIAELFIAKGAKVNAKNDAGETSLHQAAKSGSKEVAEMLISEGAKVNNKDINGFTPLHEAAYSGKTDVVELLIAKGADVNAKSKAGHTPLFWAISNHNNEVADLIRMHRKMPLKPRLEYSNGQLAIDGKAGREYEVLFSTELKEWQVLETLRLEASPQVYVDKQTADQPIRFYQLRLVE